MLFSVERSARYGELWKEVTRVSITDLAITQRGAEIDLVGRKSDDGTQRQECGQVE